MPVIKSAIKKLRRDKKREKENDVFRKSFDSAIRLAKKQKSHNSINKAVSIIDRAVKRNIIHKNKAARIKSSLSKLAKPVSKAQKTIAKTKTSKVSKKPRGK